MPAKTKKQKKVMEAISHGWKPSKPGLRKISKATAKKVLGKH